MKLCIDYRENNIINKLKNIKTECETCIENLPIGDFIIYKDTLIKLIIERKTFLDLAASITDGRFREQKSRLLDSGSPLLYIIEGPKSSIPIKLKSACNGAIQNLIYKHGINILYTTDTQDTIDNILMLVKKIDNNVILSDTLSDKPTLTQPKLFSKSDKINSSLFILQLCVIPGISMTVAQTIQHSYKNMSELFNEYAKYESILDKENLLFEMIICGKRKIGKSLSKKIYNCLFN